ncbi:MAG: hypothetical protein QOH21_1387 [Acidobacteriota bacterium]|jgi:hypothetical protein|nr:hypothetical protein [Acidobacteriota bacterium]
MSPRLRSTVREVLIFTAYVLLSVALTWPLARTLGTSVSDLGDPLLNTWILDWTSHALTHDPLGLFDPPMFVPSLHPLAYSEHLVGIALLTLPFHLAGVSPITLYNIAMLLGFALSGYAAFVLARMFTNCFFPAFAAGIFFAFVSFKFDHLAHLQIVVGSVWIAFILAALIAWWRRPDWKRAALFGAAFVMNGLTNIYFLLFATAAVGLSLVFLYFAGEKRELKAWLRIAAALLVSGLILFPFLQPYRVVSKAYQMKRPAEEVLAGSGDWGDWMRATTRSRWYGDVIPPDKHRHEHELFPGLFALTMLAAAIVLYRRERESIPARPTREVRGWLLRTLDVSIVILFLASILGTMAEPRFSIHLFGRILAAVRGSDVPMMALLILILVRLSLRMPLALGGAEGKTLRDVLAASRFPIGAWVAALWIAFGVLGSFGLRTFFFSFFFQRIEAYQSMRSPGRWAVITYAGLAVWVALGATALVVNRTGRKRLAAGVVLAVLAVIDLLPVIRWDQALAEPAPVYRWIAKERVGPVLEWPVDNWLAFRYLLGSTLHRVPLMNGSSGFEPPVYRAMRIAWEEKRYGDVLDLAERNGCRILVIHRHWWYESDPVKLVEVVKAGLATGRLQYLARFDHEMEGDYAFAVTRNFPQWQRLRAPDVPNGAGHLPSQTLQRFLAHEPVYAGSTFGQLEQPAMYQRVTGPLQISGWAMSPFGIKTVSVLLHQGSYRYEAQRAQRPELTKQYSWYYEGLPGFTLTLPKRPRGVPAETDVQIEVIDGSGKRTLFEEHTFTWEEAE